MWSVPRMTNAERFSPSWSSGNPAGGYLIVVPASTGSATPVTCRASGEASQHTALVTSAGWIHGTGGTLSEAKTGSTSTRVGA